MQEIAWRDATEENPDDSPTTCTSGTTVDPQLLHDIQVLLARLVSKASQLINNFTTNLCESWMHIRTKFDGGKQINRSQSGSWQHRCMGGGLRHNYGPGWGPVLWEKLTNELSNAVFTAAADHATKEVERCRKRKATSAAKQTRRAAKHQKLSNESVDARKAYARHDGGTAPEDIVEDISPEHLTEMKALYYKGNVYVDAHKSTAIDLQTIEQSSSDLWREERRKRLTASITGSIAKRKTKKVGNKVKELLYSQFKGNKATKWGQMHEETTRRLYLVHQHKHGHPGITSSRAGLVIDPNNPWLACSPDDRVFDPTADTQQGLVEYKNPYAARNMILADASKKIKGFCLQETEDGLTINKSHDYYYQIQCQMFVDNKLWCDFVVRTTVDFFVERVNYNSGFWNAVLPKLQTFYFDALLSELAAPRHHLGGIREPYLS